MKTILVYGSLRFNSGRGYNFGRFGKQSPISTESVSYFKLYSRINGSYPAALYTGNKNDKIIVEAHKIDDETFHKILDAETGAGYNYAQFVTDNKVVGIMFYIDSLDERDILVESGDWL